MSDPEIIVNHDSMPWNSPGKWERFPDGRKQTTDIRKKEFKKAPVSKAIF